MYIIYLYNILFVFYLLNYFFKNVKLNLFLGNLLFFFFIFSCILYINIYNYIYVYYNNMYIYYFLLSIDNFCSYLVIYNLLIAIACLYLFKNKYIHINIYIYIFIFIIIAATCIFFLTTNIIILFVSYEFILLPSAYLILKTSQNIRSRYITFYFLLWTQLGSFFVFLGVIILTYNNIFLLQNIKILSKYYKIWINLLFFIGFGIKIPMWPFHFWLTKTHVEVNTIFSIFLSGVLVKVALIGLYKFLFLYNNYFILIPITILLISKLDVALKIQSQTDLKKIIAYCTIFEMNTILVGVIVFSNNFVNYIILFCILHTTLSFIYFFFNDILYKRYGTRCIYSIPGLIINTYYILVFFLLILFFFNGIPLTLKFNLEFFLITKLYYLNIIYFLYFLFIQIYFITFFSKHIFIVCYNNFFKKVSDITKFEALIVFFNLLVLIELSIC